MLVTKLRLVALAFTFAYCLLLGPALAARDAASLRVPWILWPKALWSAGLDGRLHAASAAGAPLGTRVASFARRLLGVPYRYGGDSPSGGFDCSGLVRFVYAHFGLRLPHSSYSDFSLGVSVPRRALRPGDLVFFDGLGHVGIYVGANRFIDAPHTGGRVQLTSLAAPWYSSAYDGARRLLGRSAGRLRRP